MLTAVLGISGLNPLKCWRTIPESQQDCMCVSVQASSISQHPELPSDVLGFRSKVWIIFPLYAQKYIVFTQFSQTLNNKSPKSDDGSEEILFTSFSLQMRIHRKWFWPMFSLQPKCNRWQCSRKTVKMATLWFIGRKMTVIEIKLCYNCFYVK